MKVYLVHGFNSEKHAVWMDALSDVLENQGLEVINANYGHTNLLSVHNATQRTARDLAGVAQLGDVAIGHSNGCRLIVDALRRGAPLSHVIFINPALPVDEPIPFWVRRVDVFYAPNDLAVRAGEWLRRLNPLRWFGWSSRWGAMGAKGYQGLHPRAYNWNLGEIGHSGALAFNRRERLGGIITRLIECRLNGQATRIEQPIFRS